MAKTTINPFGPAAVSDLMSTFPPRGIESPIRAGRPRLVQGVSRMGQRQLVEAWIAERKGTSSVCVDIATCTVLADVATRLGPEPVPPSVREEPSERQSEFLTRALKDLSRAGCERVAFLGLRKAAFAPDLLSVLDKSVLEVAVAVSPEIGALAPVHWERVTVGPIAQKPLAKWIQSRMKKGGAKLKRPVAAEIIERGGPRSIDILQLAGVVYRFAKAKRKKDKTSPVERAMDTLMGSNDSLVLRVWETLSPLQQNLLRALASGERQIFSAAVRKRFGLRSTASVARSIELLGEKGLVEKALDGSGYAFESPWVRHWVERVALPDVGIRPGSA